MSKQKPFRLGNLQLAIMRALWSGGPATVADVQRVLPDRALAYTTVATMLRKMEERGLVAHDKHGRTFVYRPLVQQHDVRQGMAGDLLDRLFAGSVSSLVSHLLSDRDIGRDELEKLESLIADQRNRQ